MTKKDNKRIAELPLDKSDIKRLEETLRDLKKNIKKGQSQEIC